MTDLLGLDDWAVTAKTEEDGFEVLHAAYRPQPDTCPKCGVIGHLYKHGTKDATFWDAPHHGFPAKLKATVQRYRCRSCTETFLQPLGGIAEDRRMTTRGVAYVYGRCLSWTFTQVAEELGCTEFTVRSIAQDLIAIMEREYKPRLPAYLGIDETTIDGRLRLVLTDIQNNKPVDMLEDDSNATLATWLNHFRDRSHVRVVSTDMHKAYRNVVEQLLPGVPVVVDKFHVVRMANQALDDVRIRVAKDNPRAVGRDWMRRKSLLRMHYADLSEKQRFNLDMWLDNETELKEAHALKEAFYGFYKAGSRAEARALLSAWRDGIPARFRDTAKKEFRPLWTATGNWTENILAYWDFPVTNAYTEALNGIAKVANRAGRGYSFEVLRARLLFGADVKARGRTWVMERVARRQAGRLWATIGRTYDGHCQLCWADIGKFSRDILAALLRQGEETRRVPVCRKCAATFYTRGLVQREHVSTHLLE